MITQEQRKKVAAIVKATLVEHFADEFVFDPIEVIPEPEARQRLTLLKLLGPGDVHSFLV